MASQMSAGKLRRIAMLCDDSGIFKMMAIDQRGSLEQSLGKLLGREPKHEDVAKFKRIITQELSPYATAVLTDPLFGYASSIREIPGSIGVLLACERSGYLKAGETGKDRKTELIEEWSAAKAQRAGADAVKLLLYYHPDASTDVLKHQHEVARRVGAECADQDLPFLLETVAYAMEEPSTDSVAYARRKPDLVKRSAAEFSKPEYQVDILKLEFPVQLKYTREYRHAVFDDKEREEVYTLADAGRFCEEVDEASRLPWVILSAGVDIREFLAEVELACEAGASGFLCGRAIWKDSVPLFKDEEKMVEFLQHEGAINFLKCNAAAEAARPVWEHPRLNGVTLAKDSPDWYRVY